jgi:Ca-activated chloride channel homolog
MTFADPRFLWALLVVPVMGLLEWWASRRADAALTRLVGSRPHHPLLVQRNPRERWARAVLRLLAVACLFVGASRPEWGREVVKRGASGSDLALVVDVSASMDARDVPPSRLAEAKREALAVLDRVGGSRVGVVAFAGDAIRLCPLTLDRAAARLVIESLSSASISRPGTDLGRGLRMALKVLPGGRREEQAIVLWTDGEDLEEGAKAAIDEITRSGVRVFAVGVGTRAGDVIPVLDAEGRATDIKRDESGNSVRSRLDESLLRTLARRTHGAYFGANRPGGELPRLMSAITTVASAARGDRLIERARSRFGWFAAFAAILIAIERTVGRRRRESARETPVHSERGAAAAAVFLLVLLAPATARAQSDWAKGDRAFRAGRFAAAESLYARRLKHGQTPALHLNHATARALRGEADAAEQDLRRLAARDDKIGVESSFNLGTLLGQRRQFDPALEALRRVLEKNPRDEDARWNYELLMRRKQDEERRRQNPRQQPQPSSGGGGGGGQQPQPQPQQRSPGQQPAPQPGANPKTESAAGGHMNRSEAERILDALQELSRAEQQRQRRVRVTRDKQGRDW